MKYKFEITIGPPKSGEVCDFCSDPHVYGAFPAKTFLHKEVNGVLLSSLSGWAACETCHWLIKVEAWGALTTRSVETLLQREPWARAVPITMLRREMTLLHEQFRDNMEEVN